MRAHTLHCGNSTVKTGAKAVQNTGYSDKRIPEDFLSVDFDKHLDAEFFLFKGAEVIPCSSRALPIFLQLG